MPGQDRGRVAVADIVEEVSDKAEVNNEDEDNEFNPINAAYQRGLVEGYHYGYNRAAEISAAKEQDIAALKVMKLT